MPMPIYDGREARFRLELVPQEQGDEDDFMFAALRQLGEEYDEVAWSEEEEPY